MGWSFRVVFQKPGNRSMADQALGCFLSASGLSGPLVLGITEPGARQVSWRVFDQPFLVVGRHPGCDLVLKDPQVSQRHVYFQAIAGRIFCVDLNSRTGTQWGGEAGLWGWVQPEAGIEIGPFRLTHRADAPDDLMSEGSDLPLPISRSFAQPAFAEVFLTISDGVTESPPWQLSRSIVLIGRSTACRLRLDSPGIADVHASLVQTPVGLFAVDLLGPAGLLVNGHRTRCALLGEDNELVIGPFRIRVRCAPRWDQTSPAPLHETFSGTALDRFTRPGSVGLVDSKSWPTSLTKVDHDAAILRSLIQELGQVQHEAAVRSLESLLVALRSFSEAHDQQIHTVREELVRIRALIEGPGRQQRQPVTPTANHYAPVLRLVDGSPRSIEHRPPVRESSRPNPEIARIALQNGAPRHLAREETSGIELHDQILDRLAVIENEHESQWRKLVRSLFG